MKREKEDKYYLPIAVFLYLLALVFLLMVSIIMIPQVREYLGSLFPHISGISFTLFGIALIYLTFKQKVEGKFKFFLVLTGACAVGSFSSIILHNFIYGLFIVLFGVDFWERTGMADESLFFILGLVIFPIGFIIGEFGSIFYFINRERHISLKSLAVIKKYGRNNIKKRI